jgi:hypothetical protein
MRRFFCFLIVMAFVSPIFAQENRGWGFNGRFQGDNNSSGLVMKFDPALGYTFSPHVRAYGGLPFYIVHRSSTIAGDTAASMNGIGNAYVGLDFTVDSEAMNFNSTIEGTAPTGNQSKGFSTGKATIDWTNNFSRTFSAVTPFASVGLANTVSDTAFFVRPFTSEGLVGHFDGGARFALGKAADIGTLAYAVVGSGQQTIVSKVFDNKPTVPAPTPTPTPGIDNTKGNGKSRVFDNNSKVVGTAELANDHGFSTWLSAHPGSVVDLQIGFTRSVGYDLNTVFFGIGFHVGH